MTFDRIDSLSLYDPYFEAVDLALKEENEVFWGYFGRIENNELHIDQAKLLPAKVHKTSEKSRCSVKVRKFHRWRKKEERNLSKNKEEYRLVGLGHIHRHLPIPTTNDVEYLDSIMDNGIHSIYHHLSDQTSLQFFNIQTLHFLRLFKGTVSGKHIPIGADIVNRSEKYQNVEILSEW